MDFTQSLLAIVLLIAVSAFFSVAEISLAASRRLRLRQWADEGDARALDVLRVQEQPGYYFTTVQIGMNAVAIVGGIVGEGLLSPALQQLLRPLLPAPTADTLAFVGSVAVVTSLFVVFADLVPPALEALSPALIGRLKLVQQVRAEDVDRVAAVYGRLGLDYEIAPFFTDLPERMASSHLVVCRSGASSVAELTVIGRPSILVPLPHALDNDQKTNAIGLEKAGGAIMAEQAALTPEKLAGLIADLLADPARLAAMASAARAQGRPDAVRRLADLVEHVAAGGKPNAFAARGS